MSKANCLCLTVPCRYGQVTKGTKLWISAVTISYSGQPVFLKLFPCKRESAAFGAISPALPNSWSLGSASGEIAGSDKEMKDWVRWGELGNICPGL